MAALAENCGAVCAEVVPIDQPKDEPQAFAVPDDWLRCSNCGYEGDDWTVGKDEAHVCPRCRQTGTAVCP